MKKKLFAILSGVIIIGLTLSFGQETESKKDVPLAPKQFRRPGNLKLTNYKYSLNDLKNNFSKEMMQRAASRMETVKEVNNKGKWKPTTESIEKHVTPEWFEDAKFGMFIDWGLWSVAGWAPKMPVEDEPSALPRTYPDWYENRMYTQFKDYHEKNWGKDFKRDDFIPLFQANQYQPEKLADIAVEAGMKYIVPFTKHFTGFCLWPSSFTQRNAGDMGPKKDLIRPLVESCKQRGLKFGVYLCQEELEYPLLDEGNNIVTRLWGGKTEPYSVELEKKCSGKIPVKNYGTDYFVPLATEFIDMYDPDILWFDCDWNTSENETHTYDIASYFYNHAQGRKEVAVNDRFASQSWNDRWKHGDFYTDEGGDMMHKLKNYEHPPVWEECRGISTSYGFNWEDTDKNVISSNDFIHMFVDIVSKGGNLVLITNLDGNGALPEIQGKRLKDIGKWLKVNGEGIYSTRAYTTTSEGTICYTRSKDNKKVYAIATEWPGKQLTLKSVTPRAGSEIHMLGVEKPLKWSYEKAGGVTTILLPDNLQKESNRPCKYAYTFSIEK